MSVFQCCTGKEDNHRDYSDNSKFGWYLFENFEVSERQGTHAVRHFSRKLKGLSRQAVPAV
jgi:hypothetical protein